MFSKPEGHFPFCDHQKKVPREGLKKADRVQLHPKTMARQVGEVKKTTRQNGFLSAPSPTVNLYREHSV